MLLRVYIYINIYLFDRFRIETVERNGILYYFRRFEINNEIDQRINNYNFFRNRTFCATSIILQSVPSKLYVGKRI